MKNKTRYLLAVFCLVCSFKSNSNELENNKYTNIYHQYKTLNNEGLLLWNQVLNVDINNDDEIAVLLTELTTTKSKVGNLATGIHDKWLISCKLEIRNEQPEACEKREMLQLAHGAESFMHIISMASYYLIVKKPIYLKIAFIYEEAWRVMDRDLSVMYAN